MKFLRTLALAACIAPFFGYSAGAQDCTIRITKMAFTPTGEADLTANNTSSRVALATNGSSTPAATTVYITNLAAPNLDTVYVKTGNSTVTATVASGFPVMPGQQAQLAINSDTHIAAITAGSNNVAIRVSTGY